MLFLNIIVGCLWSSHWINLSTSGIKGGAKLFIYLDTFAMPNRSREPKRNINFEGKSLHIGLYEAVVV